MLFVDKIEVFNFEGALRGLRNPKDSWHLSDTTYDVKGLPTIGPKDLDLAQRMVGAGTDESKFMRQIFISMDITAPLYYWKEFDTYKIGTVSNSCSTMHKLADTPITKDLFSWDNEDDVDEAFWEVVDIVITECECLRQLYKKTGKKSYWRALIQLLPNSWMQKRTITLNYQVARAIYFARKNHKLTEWHTLCKTFEKLPYGKELICYIKDKKIDKITKILLNELGIFFLTESGKEISYEQLEKEIMNIFGGTE